MIVDEVEVVRVVVVPEVIVTQVGANRESGSHGPKATEGNGWCRFYKLSRLVVNRR